MFRWEKLQCRVFVHGGNDSVENGKIYVAKVKSLSRAQVEGWALHKSRNCSFTALRGKAEERVRCKCVGRFGDERYESSPLRGEFVNVLH